MISPGDKGIGIPFYSSGWLPTLILEGKAKYQLETIKNKDVIYFLSVFSNPRLRGSGLERQCQHGLQNRSVLSGRRGGPSGRCQSSREAASVWGGRSKGKWWSFCSFNSVVPLLFPFSCHLPPSATPTISLSCSPLLFCQVQRVRKDGMVWQGRSLILLFSILELGGRFW